MFALPPGLGRSPDEPLRVVALGAHADDVEIGAGGTLLRLTAERLHVHVHYAVVSATTERAVETRAAADELLARAADATVLVGALPDGRLPSHADELRAWVRETLGSVRPHLVLTHRLDDAHQDHRAVAELSWQTFRGATIAAYEIPKWEGDLGRPNAYVALDDATADAKLSLLARHFPSQHGKPWYDRETFGALLRLRGVEAGVRWAEAFHCDKLVW